MRKGDQNESVDFLAAENMLRRRQRELIYLALAVLAVWLVLFVAPKFSASFDWLTDGVSSLSGRSGIFALNKEEAAAYGIRGRRANMEDRFFALNVAGPTGQVTKVWAVMDGHGGEV